jgi:hypothetical protein
MLLASESKHNTLAEQDDDELFDLYITPYTDKEREEARQNNDRMS